MQGVLKHETFSRTVLGKCNNELSLRKSPRNPRNTLLRVPRTVLDTCCMLQHRELPINYACSEDRLRESSFLYIPFRTIREKVSCFDAPARPGTKGADL